MNGIKNYLTVKEVSEQLGITEEWVRDLIKDKKIRAVKIGRWRIKQEDLDEFIKSRTNIS